jgi:hypothetical protein
MCNKFYLFEPITTMVLISFCSAVHVVRIHAIYDKSRAILGALGAVLLFQVSERPTCYSPVSPPGATCVCPLSTVHTSCLASREPGDVPFPISLFCILDHFDFARRRQCLALGYPARLLACSLARGSMGTAIPHSTPPALPSRLSVPSHLSFLTSILLTQFHLV